MRYSHDSTKIIDANLYFLLEKKISKRDITNKETFFHLTSLLLATSKANLSSPVTLLPSNVSICNSSLCRAFKIPQRSVIYSQKSTKNHKNGRFRHPNGQKLESKVEMNRQMRRTNRKCRLWWPTHLSCLNQLNNWHSYAFLFGWFISSSDASFDIVVAFACDESSLLSMTTHMNLEVKFLK